MNYIKITDANYLPITDRKVLGVPATGMLLLSAYLLTRATLLTPTLQEEQASVIVVPNETTLLQKVTP
ncbi:hypothetical protein [Leptothoe spongobia]|uniref:Uncharacterized protein n=1 Tax=Leptothoe spongobia TAU-MAC 1115 TaxID=1967444 RepID=A0A947DHQ2_9CYAN|nr:hypothetical protein [Leptothoe spongobia]MBT9316879.1 hypothetical protein [Leptothoe spongobia TAU-MAC 1115]